MNTQIDNKVKAWLLIYSEVDDLKSATDRILALNEDKGIVDAQNYLVRADVVSGPFNIIVPVVATDAERMKRIIEVIRQLNPIVKEMVIENVKEPNPPDLGFGDGEPDANKPDKHNEWG